MPVSTSVQPSASRSAQTLMWLSAVMGRGMRSQYTPVATSTAAPAPGGTGNG